MLKEKNELLKKVADKEVEIEQLRNKVEEISIAENQEHIRTLESDLNILRNKSKNIPISHADSELLKLDLQIKNNLEQIHVSISLLLKNEAQLKKLLSESNANKDLNTITCEDIRNKKISFISMLDIL